LELTKDNVEEIIKCGMLNIENLGNMKGGTVVIHKGKSYYVWKKENTIFFQKKWIWSRIYKFEISSVIL
jgi:hypothetical protein